MVCIKLTNVTSFGYTLSILMLLNKDRAFSSLMEIIVVQETTLRIFMLSNTNFASWIWLHFEYVEIRTLETDS